MATLGPQPLIPTTTPQVETLGPSPVINAMEPAMAAQGTVGTDLPPAQVTIKPPSEAFMRSVNAGERSSNPYDVFKPAPKAPLKAPKEMQALAWIAMLASGDFKPMMELKNMERKAASWNKYTEIIPEMNRLIADGKHDKAIELFHTAQGELGVASPELAALVAPMQAKIYDQIKVKKQSDALIAAANVNFYKLPEAEQKAKAHLHKAQIDKLKFGGTLPTEEAFKMYMGYAVEESVTPDPSGRGLYFHDKLGNVRQYRGEIPFDEQNLKGYIGQTMSNALGIPQNEIANIMRDKTDPRYQIVSALYTNMMGFEAQRTLTNEIGRDPATVQSARLVLGRQGFGPEEINSILATGGAYTSSIGGKSVQRNVFEDIKNEQIAQQRITKGEVLKAEEDVPLRDTERAQQNVEIVGMKASGNDFTVARPGMSLAEADASGGKYRAINKKVYLEQIQPIASAISRVKNITDMFRVMGNPESYPGQVVAGVRSNWARWFPGAAGPSDVKIEALRSVIGDALETIDGKMTNLPDSMRGSAKNLVRGDFANANAAISGIQEYVRVAEDHLDRLMGESALSVTRPIPTPKETRQQTATGRTQPASGEPPDPITAMQNQGINIIEGVPDLDRTLGESAGWTQETASALGLAPTTPVRELVNVISSMAVADLKNRKIPNAEQYLVGPTDTKEQALTKIKQAQSLLTVKRIPDARPKGKGKLGPPAAR